MTLLQWWTRRRARRGSRVTRVRKGKAPSILDHFSNLYSLDNSLRHVYTRFIAPQLDSHSPALYSIGFNLVVWFLGVEATLKKMRIPLNITKKKKCGTDTNNWVCMQSRSSYSIATRFREYPWEGKQE